MNGRGGQAGLPFKCLTGFYRPGSATVDLCYSEDVIDKRAT